MNPGYQHNLEVLELRLEDRPLGQEVDGLGEAVAEDGGRIGDVTERNWHAVESAVLVPGKYHQN